MTNSRNAELSRRDFLRFASAGAALTSMSGWLNVMAAHAAGIGVKHKSCILLWMEGGPSQKDTHALVAERSAGRIQQRGLVCPFDKFAERRMRPPQLCVFGQHVRQS